MFVFTVVFVAFPDALRNSPSATRLFPVFFTGFWMASTSTKQNGLGTKKTPVIGVYVDMDSIAAPADVSMVISQRGYYKLSNAYTIQQNTIIV